MRKPSSSRGPSTELSEREMQVLNLERQGLRNKEIAIELQLKEGTVKSYLVNARRKTGEHKRRRHELGESACDTCAFRGLARFLQVVVRQVVEESV
jgi:DNA-binding NarL/FixJ family response regulator